MMVMCDGHDHYFESVHEDSGREIRTRIGPCSCGEKPMTKKAVKKSRVKTTRVIAPILAAPFEIDKVEDLPIGILAKIAAVLGGRLRIELVPVEQVKKDGT